MSSPSPRYVLREAPAEVAAETQQVPQPVFAQPVRRGAGALVAGVAGFVIVGVAFLVVGWYFLEALGPQLTIVGAVLALVPLAVVLFGIRWIDQWEPEPPGLFVFAFLWGAGVAVLLAIFVDSGIQEIIAASGRPSEAYAFLQAAVQAPIVEEAGKGLAVLLIFLVARASFDGPVDGIVYGAAVAAGFAFAENIQYFGLELAQSGGLSSTVGEVFFVRGILSPFAHVMFTAVTGLAIGLAARSGSRLLGVAAFLAGLVPAILLHAFWNGALFFVRDFYGYYAIVQVPLFVLAVAIVAGLRRRETTLTQLRLAEYAEAGWFNPAEVRMLGTPAGRRQARAWASQRGLGPVMRAYIKDATALAFTRGRILAGREVPRSQARETALLRKIAASRHALVVSVPQR